MMTSSRNDPWRAAAASPKGTPSPIPIPTAKSATAIDVRAPTMIIENKSRPKWSVPSQWTKLGRCSLSGIFNCVTSNGTQTKDTMAISSTNRLTTAPKVSERVQLMNVPSGADPQRHRPDQPKNLPRSLQKPEA